MLQAQFCRLASMFPSTLTHEQFSSAAAPCVLSQCWLRSSVTLAARNKARLYRLLSCQCSFPPCALNHSTTGPLPGCCNDAFQARTRLRMLMVCSHLERAHGKAAAMQLQDPHLLCKISPRQPQLWCCNDAFSPRLMPL